MHYENFHEGFASVPPDYYREGLNSLSGQYLITNWDDMPPELLSGHPLIVSNIEISPILSERIRKRFLALEILSFVVVPLVRENKLIRTLSVASNTPREWTPREVRLIEEVGECTWDVVERTLAEKALKESEQHALELVEKLRQADQNKTTFLKMLSHELRNPLASIMMSLSLQNQVSPGGKEDIKARKVMGRQTAHLSWLVDDQ